ncbi:DUF6603 domain-containing protein [Herpetosiphon gulosus]|uniref:DUF6603 domain-containing protein n=1 Tax=Herpetosiphon gulosus TaxID=1973496 RepID=A0ABP9X8L1_9CHLR
MTTLSELRSSLLAAVQTDQLALTPALATDPSLATFISLLPSGQLLITQPVIAPDDPTTTLTVTGNVALDWPVPGTNGELVHVQHVLITYTQATTITATLTANGVLAIDQSLQLALDGTFNPASLQIDWQQAANANSVVALATLANVVSGGQLTPFLPLLDQFQSGPLSTTNLSLGPNLAVPTIFTITSDLNTTWTIIEGWVAITGVGITLQTSTVLDPRLGWVYQLQGNIHGTLVLDQPYRIEIGLLGQENWQLLVVPNNGNLVPSLDTMAGIVGGSSLQASIQSGLNALGLSEVSIDQVSVQFNPYALRLRTVAMLGHITIQGLRFNLQVFLPDFGFFGQLDSSTPIDLAALITLYFGNPASFPALAISKLKVSTVPSQGYYDFFMEIDTDWTMYIGTVALGLRGIALQITQKTDSVTGFGETLLIFADAPFDVSVDYEDGAWVFTGRTLDATDSNSLLYIDDASIKPMQIGHLISAIVESFSGAPSTIPQPIAELTLEKIYIRFASDTYDFNFACEAKFPINNQELDITVTIDVLHTQQGYTTKFGGTLKIGSLIFTLQFASDPNSNLFIATYSHTSDQASISVKELLGFVSTDVAAYIPESLTIDLKDVLFAYQQDTQTRFAFGFDLAASLNLSDLPLVGKAFPSNQTLAVQDLQVLIASLDFPATVVSQLNTVLATQHILALPSPLVEGITVSALIDFGTSTQALSMPLAGDSSTVTPPTPPTSTTSVVTSNASAKWFDVKKGFGPVYFERIGVQYQDSTLWFLLDASLTAAGLTLTVEGLGFGSPLNVFSPSFRIQGLGLDYRNAVVEIGGAFVHTTVSNQGKTYDEYDGMATLRVKQFSLGAIGSYAYLDDHPSLFVYAVLDFPLGGPAFFFVTGLSAGFGYNRSLIVPPIEQIASFPLVAEAISGPPSTVNSDPQQTIQTELALLRQYIPPSIGEMFLTAGIRFNSFRLIDSFALLTVSFGQHFEVDLLGLSTAIIPTPDLASTISPLAEIQMALVASFIPDQGFLGVRAQLTSASYLLSRSCHLTGGFAFYAWFAKEHAGDFVLTLGGYHPSFTIPPHYPQVPRLGFNWQIDSSLILKGGMYFALTGSLLMAGGSLQATWQSGNLKAWFNAAADFLLGWKPYHYDARLSVDIGVSYTFHLFGTHHITADVGADLHIWGPDFSGTARIDLDIISFDISFGAAAAKTPKPIDWTSFNSSFLPDPTAVCGVAVGSGLVQTPQGDPTCDWVINPSSFLLTTNSLIPTTSASFGQTAVNFGSSYALNVGVAPMAVAPSSLTSHQIIQITHNGVSFEHDFALTPIAKGMPNALWGTEFQPNLKSAPILPNAIAGFEIRPQQPPAPGSTSAINQSYLEYNTQTVADGFAWQADRPFVAQTADDAQRRTTISTTLNAQEPSATRESLLAAFGLDCPINLQASLAQSYVIAPQVGSYADENL